MVSENYACGFTTPTGKLAKGRLSEKNRGVEKGREASVLTHSQATWQWPGPRPSVLLKSSAACKGD